MDVRCSLISFLRACMRCTARPFKNNDNGGNCSQPLGVSQNYQTRSVAKGEWVQNACMCFWRAVRWAPVTQYGDWRSITVCAPLTSTHLLLLPVRGSIFKANLANRLQSSRDDDVRIKDAWRFRNCLITCIGRFVLDTPALFSHPEIQKLLKILRNIESWDTCMKH